MGRPLARLLASVTRSGRIPSCSWAKKVPVRPMPGLHLVDAEQRPDLEGELGRGLCELRLERDHAALAEHGLEQDQRRVRGGCERRLERLDVVRPGERDAGDERPEALPLRRLTRGRQGAERAAVEAAFERHDPRPAGCLARDLEGRLVRLGARVAEERPPAFESFCEQRGESQHRLRPVEVRRVPETVELLVRGGERRRSAVPETDDGDPGDEVEVLAAACRPTRGTRRRARS